MKKYVLFGKGISYSLSPIVHKTIAEYYGVDLDYEIKDCKSLKKVQELLSSGEYAGANVTMPYKVSLMDYMDEYDSSAYQSGALNTISIENSKLKAYNTDSQGFLDVFKMNDYDPKNKRVMVYGTGGVARAIVNALLDSDAKQVLLEGRNPESKLEIFRIFEKKSHERMMIIYGQHGLITDLVVNATTVGSEVFDDLSIDIDRLDTRAVFDVVYHPTETKLIQLARKRKLPTFTGIDMLICQAIRAFYIWNPDYNRKDIDEELFALVKEKIREKLEENKE